MIYKFKSKEEINGKFSYLELSKQNSDMLVNINTEDDNFSFTISKETLYNVIGSMHSIQTNIRKEVKNG